MHAAAITALLLSLHFVPSAAASNCDALADVCVCLSEENAQCFDTNFHDLTFLRALRNRSRFTEIIIYHNSIPVLKDLAFHGLQLTNLRTIRLVHNGIAAIEQRAFHGLRKLKKMFLVRNNIKTLHPDTFQNSTKLQILDLSNNQLSHINALRDVPSLEDCRASDNSISSLPNNAFTSLRTSRLKKLVLANNEISNIHRQAFNGLPNLETLTLTNNRITYLHPHTFQNTTKLRQLDLEVNQIKHLNFVRNVPSLKYLTLFKNRITTLENDTFVSTPPSSLTHINLADNKITTIDHGAFQGLYNVWSLILSGNDISHIYADTFDNATNLRFLDLKNNRISHLHFVRNIIMLWNLELSNNSIETLPAETFFNPNITQLMNNITAEGNIPVTFILTRTITNINLSNNMISSIESKALEGLVKLHQLDLSGNNISFLHPNLFEYNTQLNKLYLRNNKLSDIKVLLKIPSLEVCDLTNNNISALSTASIRNNTLSHLHLVNNNITSLHSTTFRNFSSLTLLNLMDNQIRVLDFVANLSTLEQLNLSNNAISKLSNNTLPIMLKIIDLSHNVIRQIESEVFGGLYNLSILNMSKNKITFLHSDIFSTTTSLKELNLQQNKISHINFVSKIPSLKNFIISDNYISVISNATFLNSNLVSIRLDDNKITNVQERAFQNLRQLQHLSLVGNSITYFHPHIFLNTTNLKTLNLNKNNFTLITFLSIVSSLEDIDLSENYISSLPNGILANNNACRLNRINFSKNRITTIGHLAFHNLFRLQEIDLSGNAICSLSPETFRTCPSLLKLDLSSNRISQIEIIKNVPRLKHLYLFNNTISTLSNWTFSTCQLTQLVHLNLSRNRLSSIDAGAFHSLRLLKFLDLSLNNLTFLPQNLFQNNTLLVSLDVSRNRIARVDIALRASQNLEFYNLSNNAVSVVPDNAFASNLRYLDMSNNNITFVAQCAFQGLSRLRFVDLTGNTASAIQSAECSTDGNYSPGHLDKERINLYEVSNSELDKFAKFHLWIFQLNSNIKRGSDST